MPLKTKTDVIKKAYYAVFNVSANIRLVTPSIDAF